MLAPPPPHWISRRPGRGVVLLHGMVMSPVFWAGFAPPVVRTGACVAYSLPGHHPWALDGATLDTDGIVGAYGAAIERDFDGPIDVVGHSTGGFMGLLLAARRPDLVRSVVLLGGFACGRFEGRELLSMRVARMPVFGAALFSALYRRWISSPDRFRHGATSCVAKGATACETTAARQVMEQVRLSLRQTDPGDIIAMVNWMSRTAVMENLASIRCPVLNIVGGRDAVVPPRHQMRVQARLPSALTVLLPGAGHLPMIEARREVDIVISRFLRGLPLAFGVAAGTRLVGPRNETGALARPGELAAA